jgi:hypothetical protein
MSKKILKKNKKNLFVVKQNNSSIKNNYSKNSINMAQNCTKNSKEEKASEMDEFKVLDQNKAVMSGICKWKVKYPDMSFLNISSKFGIKGDSLLAIVEVFESLSVDKEHSNNKILNAMIKLIADKELKSYEDISNMLSTRKDVYYKGINLLAMAGVLKEIIEIDSSLESLLAADFNVIPREDSVLLKIVKNYNIRKVFAKADALLIEDELYDLYAGYEK